MKVCLYFENLEKIKQSGIGRALKHQQKALGLVGIEHTLNPNDDYDVLHVNTIFLTSMNAIRQARKRMKPVVYHAHTTEEDFRNSFLLSNQLAPLVKARLINLYGSSDLIITPTPYSKSLLINYGLEQPIKAISNGIDLNRFKKDVEKEKVFRKYFNLEEGQKVVVSVGLWIKRKGIIDFMEVAKKMPEVTFIWFGQTNLALLTREIKKIIKHPPANVVLPGYVTGDIIEGAFSGADLFFFPSYEETEGIVILEALASHQQIIARNIPVYSPWLENGVNSYLADNNDQFIELIERSLAGKLPHLGENGYLVALERDLKLVGEKLKESYLEAMEINKKNLDAVHEKLEKKYLKIQHKTIKKMKKGKKDV